LSARGLGRATVDADWRDRDRPSRSGRGPGAARTSYRKGLDELAQVASGIRCKRDGRGSGFMVILGDGTDIFGAVVVPGGGCFAWLELAGRVEEGAAQVLEVAEPVAGHGQAAPAAGGTVQDGPDQGEAGGLAGQAAD